MMRPRSQLFRALVVFAAVGCGLRPVELGFRSDAPSAGSNENVAGQLDEGLVAQLRNGFDVKAMKGLDLLYPRPPELTLPANVAPVTFEWRGMPGMGAMPKPDPMMMPAPAPDPMMGKMNKSMPGPAAQPIVAFGVRLRGPRGELRMYTTAAQAAFPIDRWRRLLADHAGLALQLDVRALRGDGSFLQAEPLTIDVWPASPAGILYAWSTTTQGLSRATLDSSHERLITPPSPLATSQSRPCVGCHNVSRDGKQLLASAGDDSQLWTWPLANGTARAIAPPGEPDAASYTFATFDPTAARIAVNAAGRLSIVEADSGQILAQSSWPVASDYPSWSPDGRSLAIVLPGEGPAAMGSRLVRVSVALDGSLGTPEPLVTAMMDETLRAPCHAPDGDWIAFERRRGPMRDAKDSTLWLVAADGGEPIQLGDKPEGGASDPTFMPADVPGRAFLLFSSRRAVGSFEPAEGQHQLFARALDLQLAAAGSDPSRPAFWLPFQQRSSSYLRVLWAPALSACTPGPELCDGADDDCDQQVDENCCQAQPEVCGDPQDEDCDGAVDEGCDCVFQEQCGNAIDDDCDRRIDEEPCMPAMGR